MKKDQLLYEAAWMAINRRHEFGRPCLTFAFQHWGDSVTLYVIGYDKQGKYLRSVGRAYYTNDPIFGVEYHTKRWFGGKTHLPPEKLPGKAAVIMEPWEIIRAPWF